jgi:hypothetical protein
MHGRPLTAPRHIVTKSRSKWFWEADDGSVNFGWVRVDRLTRDDRALLQAASVIGRQFEPELLAAVVGEPDIDARLAPMLRIDLVYQEGAATHL